MIALIGTITPAVAQEQAPMTIGQCRAILFGLNALNCAGEQLGGHCATDARQYKLGNARITIAIDVSALSAEIAPIENGQAAFVRELPVLPDPSDKGRAAAEAENNKKIADNWATALKLPCHVSIGKIPIKELRIGDGSDENAIPPEVLSAIAPIISGLK